ncbi:hypothetical protein M9458_032475, partial [Cirrhinus mrigala]
SFLDRQPEMAKADYQQLQQALIKEFADPEPDKKPCKPTTPGSDRRISEHGTSHEWKRTSTSRLVACPQRISIQQLRDLAHKAYVKQRAASEKTVKKAPQFAL